MDTLRIMSNNIWRQDENNAAWAAAGADCSAERRMPGFFRLYTETKPDILGIQECSPHMADLLMRLFQQEHLPYALLWGKDTPILYRTDKFALEDSDFHIYDESVPGFEGSFNNFATKSYCIAVLREKKSGQHLIFASTHLWWKSSDSASPNYQPHSDEARAWQLNLLMDRMDILQAQYNCPIVIVGDLNAQYDSLAVQSALNRGYVHAHDIAAEFTDETAGMHYCYPDRYDTKPYALDFSYSIDHILIRGAQDGFVRRFERYSPAYYMPLSDHFPVWIDSTL